MKVITIHPINSHQYVAFYSRPASEVRPITFPFSPNDVQLERKIWESHGYKVIVRDELWAEVD